MFAGAVGGTKGVGGQRSTNVSLSPTQAVTGPGEDPREARGRWRRGPGADLSWYGEWYGGRGSTHRSIRVTVEVKIVNVVLFKHGTVTSGLEDQVTGNIVTSACQRYGCHTRRYASLLKYYLQFKFSR